jgi:O-glycosyl hydrolase
VVGTFLFFLVLGTVRTVAAQPDVQVVLDGNDTGRIFDGVGAASGGGTVSRLMINYPEPQRSQILDYLFLPNYGASLQSLKVEIGGDGNSTEGSEPSHMHRAGDENYDRGFEWWIMNEARRRNPRIKLMALAWDFPGWLKEANSQSTADYLANFLLGAKRVHGLDIDYVGIWNETKMSYEFIKTLEKTLQAHHIDTRIMADDLVNTWDIVSAMQSDRELYDAVKIVCTHYPRFQSTGMARKVGKPLWSSEDGPWNDTWGTAGEQSGPYAELLNRNYIEGKMTSTVLWCLTTSYYDILDIPYAGLLRADTPWSGHFTVMAPLWIVAHTTQFAQPGWQYLDGASTLLPDGGSIVALKSGPDYSVVVETLAAGQSQDVTFAVRGGLSAGRVYVWRTNSQRYFEKISEIVPAGGKFSFRFDPNSIYSLTTTRSQHKGEVEPPAASPFPVPYKDDFEEYRLGDTTPKYFIEQNGSYEVVPCGGGRKGKCLRQVVTESPLVWTYGKTADLLGTASIIGDKAWRNYSVSADLLLETPGYGRVMGRVSRATLDGQITGYQLYLYDSGHWELRTSTQGGVIASGQVRCSLNTWHHLELSFLNETIAASIDHRMVASLRDTQFAVGMAGIGNAWNNGQYDNFEIQPVAEDVPIISVPKPVPVSGPPPTPTLFVPTPLNQSVRLSWSPVDGATRYQVRYGTREGEYRSQVDAGTLTAYKITTLTNGTAYYFVVVAVNAAGESKPSNVARAVPEP